MIRPQLVAVDECPIGASQISQDEQLRFAEYRGVSAGDVEIIATVERDGAQRVSAKGGVRFLDERRLALTIPRKEKEPGFHGSTP